MPLYTLAGTPVDFPHAAYGTQLVLMAKVVTAADAGAHALLEAPTLKERAEILIALTEIDLARRNVEGEPPLQ